MLPPFAVAGAVFRARSTLARLRNVREAVTNSAPVSYVRESPGLGAAVRALALGVVAAGLIGGLVWWARHDAARDRDEWWRNEISRRSSVVRERHARDAARALATDADVLKGIEHHDGQLRDALDQLEKLRKQPQPPAPASDTKSVPGRADRCSLPADCLR